MSDFMQPQSVKMTCYHVETSHGTEIIPADLVGSSPDLLAFADYCEGEPEEFTRESGWYARLSAPGYMDCTSWTGPHSSEREALGDLADTFDLELDLSGLTS